MILHVNCNSNAGLVKKEREMIFERKCFELFEEIPYIDSMIMLKSDIKN